jgi:structural maintenance of chromosome 3 (chondroitin sulfate proteoglycan 6)
VQIESKRNVLEIELNENLRKRREELRTKLDNIGGTTDASGSVGDLESRNRELKSFNVSIDNLKKQEACKSADCHFLY